VNEIEKRHNQNKLKLHKKIVTKNNKERNNFISSLDKYLTKQKEESVIRQEKAFQKYQTYVSYIYIINYQI
jgi:hypothetical protein